MESEKWVMPACTLSFCLCAAGAWLDDQQGAAYLFMVFVASSLAVVRMVVAQRAISWKGQISASDPWQTLEV